MAMFKPVRVSSSNLLDSVPKIEGQFIVDEESQTLYFDKSSSERVAVGSSGTLIGWNNQTAPGGPTDNFYTKDEIDDMIGDIETLMAEL